MRYNVITANHMEDQTLGIINHSSLASKGLISLVNEKLAEGWRPQGGVFRTEGEKGEDGGAPIIVTQDVEFDW